MSLSMCFLDCLAWDRHPLAQPVSSAFLIAPKFLQLYVVSNFFMNILCSSPLFCLFTEYQFIDLNLYTHVQTHYFLNIQNTSFPSCLIFLLVKNHDLSFG